MSFLSVNQTAFLTSAALAASTVGLGLAAAATASKAAAIACGFFAITLSGVSLASITAWFDRSSTTPSKYFNNIKNHAGYVIAGTYQLIAQTIIQSLIKALSEGIFTKVKRAISGPDVTIKNN